MPTMQSGLVSTIIPVYNRPDFLPRAVDSVLQQSYDKIEILIVDDGSTDNTVEIAKKLVEQNPQRIRLFCQANGGAGVARERGRQEAAGEFIQYLDSDDRLLPNKFKTQVAALQANLNADIAYGKTRLVDAAGEVLVAPFKRTGEAFTALMPLVLADRWWNTHTPLFRRRITDRIGPWCSRRIAEDWDYDARAGGAGAVLVFCDEYASDTYQHGEGRLTTDTPTIEQLREYAQLMPVLYENALQANVAVESAEMRHFSRWCFSLARQLGVFKTTDCRQMAADLLSLAKRSDSAMGKGLQFRLFDLLRAVFGWRVAVGLVETFRSLALGQKAGKNTLKQSWMLEAD